MKTATIGTDLINQSYVELSCRSSSLQGHLPQNLHPTNPADLQYRSLHNLHLS